MAVPKAEINGNICTDPKEGTDSKGQRYLFVRVATSDSRKDEQTQQWETLRELFVNVQAFRVSADVPSPAKGDKVVAYGKLFEEKYTTNQGEQRTNVVLNADYIKVFPKNGGSYGGNAAPGASAQGFPQQQFQGGGMSPSQFVQNSLQNNAGFQQQPQDMQQAQQNMSQQGFIPQVNTNDPWSTV